MFGMNFGRNSQGLKVIPLKMMIGMTMTMMIINPKFSKKRVSNAILSTGKGEMVCPHCNQKIKDADIKGFSIKCPHCKKMV